MRKAGADVESTRGLQPWHALESRTNKACDVAVRPSFPTPWVSAGIPDRWSPLSFYFNPASAARLSAATFATTSPFRKAADPATSTSAPAATA